MPGKHGSSARFTFLCDDMWVVESSVLYGYCLHFEADTKLNTKMTREDLYDINRNKLD